jgi:AraC-like DNA-binding protein
LGVKLLDNPTLGGRQLIKNYLEIFLISLMRSLSETARGPETFLRGDETSPHSIVGVIKILEDEVEGKVTIGEICARVGYSRAYLFKEFKLATGKTIMEYYRELKINRAKKLLRRGDLSVKQIAEALSFDTANYFVKTFKRLTGVTPLAYKKTYSAKERR